MEMETLRRKKANDPHDPSEIILGLLKSLKHLDVTVLSPADRHKFLHFQCAGFGCSVTICFLCGFPVLHCLLRFVVIRVIRTMVANHFRSVLFAMTYNSEHLSIPSYLWFYPSASPAGQATQVRDSPKAKQRVGASQWWADVPAARLCWVPPTHRDILPPLKTSFRSLVPVSGEILKFTESK